VYTAHSLRNIKVVLPAVPSPLSNTPNSCLALPTDLLDCLMLHIPLLCKRGRVSLSRIRNNDSIRSCAALHGRCVSVFDALPTCPTYSQLFDDSQCCSEGVVFIDQRKYDILAVDNVNGRVFSDITEL